MDADTQFFINHPDRYAHIRLPQLELQKTPQRGVFYVQECSGQFWSLGVHNVSRRRIILWRPPPDHPSYDAKEHKILKIPFLAFADESIEDTDAVLLPLVQQIMLTAVGAH